MDADKSEKKVVVCVSCGGKNRHNILSAGLTEEHRRSHAKRAVHLDVREMGIAAANAFVAKGAERLPFREERSKVMIAAARAVRKDARDKRQAAMAERKAERAAASEANQAEREAKRTAVIAPPAATEVVVDPHAGQAHCGACDRWMPAEHLTAHQRSDKHLLAVREQRADAQSTEAWKEFLVDDMPQAYADLIPDTLEVAAAEEVSKLAPLPPPNPAPLVAKQAKAEKGFFAKFFGS